MEKLVTTEQGFEDSINILMNKVGLLKYCPNPIWALNKKSLIIYK